MSELSAPRYYLMKLVRLGKGFCAWTLLLFTFACCATVAAHAEDRKPEKRVSPVYPELAKRMRIGGVVRVAATVLSSFSNLNWARGRRSLGTVVAAFV